MASVRRGSRIFFWLGVGGRERKNRKDIKKLVVIIEITLNKMSGEEGFTKTVPDSLDKGVTVTSRLTISI